MIAKIHSVESHEESKKRLEDWDEGRWIEGNVEKIEKKEMIWMSYGWKKWMTKSVNMFITILYKTRRQWFFKHSAFVLHLEQTSNARSPYRCGRVGRGIQPPALPQPHPQPPSNTLTHKQFQLQHQKYAFFVFQLERDNWSMADGPTDQRTNGWTKPLIELRVRN